MRRNTRVTICLIFIIAFVIIIAPIKAHAAWNDNAYDFYDTWGEEKEAKYNAKDKAWYFGQRGITRSSNTYYSIIGFRIRVINNGTTYHCGVKVGDTMGAKPDVVKDGYTYSLWYVTFDRLMTQLKAENPNADFSFMYDKNSDTDIYFDARVTWYNAGVKQGDVNSNGTTNWGIVWNNPNDKSQWKSWIPQKERDDLFNIKATISGSQKHSVTISDSQIKVVESTSGTIYKPNSTNRYFIKKDSPLSIQYTATASAKANNYMPNAMYYIVRDSNNLNGGHTDVIYSKLGNTSTSSTSSGFDVNSGVISKKESATSRNSDKTTMTFKVKLSLGTDGKKLNFTPNSRIYTGGAYSDESKRVATSTWYDSSKQLELICDGSAPYSNSFVNATISNTKLKIVQDGVTDKLSGVNSSSIYAYIYKEGNSSKGNKITLSKVGSTNSYSKDSIAVGYHINDLTYKGNVVIEV